MVLTNRRCFGEVQIFKMHTCPFSQTEIVVFQKRVMNYLSTTHILRIDSVVTVPSRYPAIYRWWV